MPRFFTLSDAEALLPELEGWVRRAVALAQDLREAEREVRAFNTHIMASGGAHIDTGRAAAAKGRLQSAGQSLQGELVRIEEAGVLLKDLDAGLIDFPTLFEGREVYLCWKLDETGIGFWHEVTSGFAGRKPVDDYFRDHHSAGTAEGP